MTKILWNSALRVSKSACGLATDACTISELTMLSRRTLLELFVQPHWRNRQTRNLRLLGKPFAEKKGRAGGSGKEELILPDLSSNHCRESTCGWGRFRSTYWCNRAFGLYGRQLQTFLLSLRYTRTRLIQSHTSSLETALHKFRHSKSRSTCSSRPLACD